VLPQLSGLEFPFSVREVVELGRHPHGDAGTARGHATVDRAIAALELETLADASYPRLSGGERQRAHAARTLVQVDGVDPPGWLLLDEPTSALDLVHQHRLMGQVRSFARSGGGAVAVLHDPNLAAAYADRLVLLAEGRVMVEGPVAEVLRPAILREVYGVEVEVLELPGRAHPVVIAGPPAP
jgi:iron complex transport system ATP-binding protein